MSGDKLKYDVRLWVIRFLFLAAGLIVGHFGHHLTLWEWVQDQSGFTCSWNNPGFTEKWSPFN